MIVNAALVLLLVTSNAPSCTRSTSFVRVQFHHCAPLGQTISVKIEGTPVTLEKQGDFYQGQYPGDITETYAITLPKNYPLCCRSAIKVAKERRSRDCVVSYVVTCDERTPGWSFVASSDLNEITFEFDAEHEDDFGDRACNPPEPMERARNGISNLGTHDVVALKVMRGRTVLVSIPLHQSDLVQAASLPYSRAKLESLIDAAARNGVQNGSGPAKNYIATVKALLPNVVTVERR
jgi:hypothetical protein